MATLHSRIQTYHDYISIQIIRTSLISGLPRNWTEDRCDGPSICRNLMSNWSINLDWKWYNLILSLDHLILSPQKILTTRIWYCYQIICSWTSWIWPCRTGSWIWDNLTTFWGNFWLMTHPLVLLTTGNWSLLMGGTLCFTKDETMSLMTWICGVTSCGCCMIMGWLVTLERLKHWYQWKNCIGGQVSGPLSEIMWKDVVYVSNIRLIGHLPIPPTCWSLWPWLPGLLHGPY